MPLAKYSLFILLAFFIVGSSNVAKAGGACADYTITTFNQSWCQSSPYPTAYATVSFAITEDFDNTFKKIWHTYGGAVPIDRQAGGKDVLRWAVNALKKGKIIAIHPEGTRSLTGRLQKAKTGVARLALGSKVPVIPIGLIGTFEILPKGKYIPKLKRAEMNIGEPIYFDKYYNKRITKKLLREVTNIIMKEIAKLSKQKYNF